MKKHIKIFLPIVVSIATLLSSAVIVSADKGNLTVYENFSGLEESPVSTTWGELKIITDNNEKILKHERTAFTMDDVGKKWDASTGTWITVSDAWNIDSGSNIALSRPFTGEGTLTTTFKIKRGGGAKQRIVLNFPGISGNSVKAGQIIFQHDRVNFSYTGGQQYTMQPGEWYDVIITHSASGTTLTTTINVKCGSETVVNNATYTDTVSSINVEYLKLEDLRKENIADCGNDTPTYTTSVWYLKDLKVKGDVDLTEDEVSCRDAKAALRLSQDGTTVTEAFTLPTSGENGTAITWSSGTPASLSVSGNTATPIRGDNNETVTLTATIKKGTASETKTFTVTVKAADTMKFETGSYSTVNNNDGTTTVSITLTDKGNLPSKFASVSLMAYKTDAQGRKTGNIVADEKSASSLSANETFSVTVATPASGEKIKTFFLGDGNISLKDNAPAEVAGLTATPMVKKITLRWTPSEDDSGRPVKYDVYQGNSRIAQNLDSTSYNLENPAASSHSYKVVCIDAASNATSGKTTDSVAPVKMYGAGLSYGSYGIEKRENNGSAAYSVDSAFNSERAYTCDANNREYWIAFVKNGDCTISDTDRELVFEIEYLDNGTTPLTLYYNSIQRNGETEAWRYAMRPINFVTRTNTNTFKTATFKVTDAALSNSATAAGTSFGIKIPASLSLPSDQVWIKSIKVIQYDKYGAAVEDKTP